jgi:DNA-binding GntR family transcriptional regulator
MTEAAGEAPPPEPGALTPSRERFERILRTLRDRICLLHYPPGTQLGEAELAEEHGVSRTPIRGVLGRLEAEGLVERRHGVGTIVVDADITALEPVYRLRIALAPLMGRLAPLRYGPGDLAALRHHLARCERLAREPDPPVFTRLNMDFSMALHAMIGNGPLREIIERLYFQTSRIWLKSVPSLNLAFEIEIFRRQIVDVIAALEIADHPAVGDICSAHISMSFTRMRRYAADNAEAAPEA